MPKPYADECLESPWKYWASVSRVVVDYPQVPDDRVPAWPSPVSAGPDTGTRLDCPAPVQPETGTAGSAACGLSSGPRCFQSCQWEAVPDSWNDASAPPIRGACAPFSSSSQITIIPRPIAGLPPVRDGNQHSAPPSTLRRHEKRLTPSPNTLLSSAFRAPPGPSRC
jgi:hypothetical protein